MIAATAQLPTDRPWILDELVLYFRMEKLKYPKKQISRWIQEGRLKCGRRGRVPLVTKQQADSFLLLNPR